MPANAYCAKCARGIKELTARRVAMVAGTTPSSVSYHFGSQEQLVIATAERVYKRLNAERLPPLNAAVQRTSPDERR